MGGSLGGAEASLRWAAPARDPEGVSTRERSAHESLLKSGRGVELPPGGTSGIFAAEQGGERASPSAKYPERLSRISLGARANGRGPRRSWRAGELARLCGLSERHFFRRFKEATGFSPINWLRRERISFARAKLLEDGSSIKQVADQVGYNDVFFFSRDFKRQTGSCPSEYRRARSSAANGKSDACTSRKPAETHHEYGRIFHAKGGILHSTYERR